MTSMERVLGEKPAMEEVKKSLATALAFEFGLKIIEIDPSRLGELYPVPAIDDRGDVDKEPAEEVRYPEILGTLPKPAWLKKRLPPAGDMGKVTNIVETGGLHTVCREAHCPNKGGVFFSGNRNLYDPWRPVHP